MSPQPSPDGPDVWCIVVAGGSGARFGAMKQFAALDGSRVIDRSVAVAAATCTGVVAVVPREVIGTPDGAVPGADVVVAGGATRAGSVRAGLAAVPQEAAIVLVHDAARPLASAALFDLVIEAVASGADAVVPAVPVIDTIRRVDGGVVDRDGLRAVQTPQGFPAPRLRAAHAGAVDATDDAGLVELDGGTVRLVDGEPTNIKMTAADDLVVAEALLSGRGAGGSVADGGDSAS